MTALEELLGTTDPKILLAILTLAFGLFCATYFGLFVGREERRARDRLDVMGRRMRGLDSRQAEQARARLRRVEVDSRHPVLDQLLKRFLPNRDELRARLARTGRKWTVGDYVLACLFIGGVVVAGFCFVGLDLPVALIGGLVIGAGVPHIVIGRLGRRRVDRFNAMFPDAIDLIVRALRSGIPIQEAVATVGREMKEPVGPLFARVTNEVRLGGSIEDAFWNAADTIRAPEFNFLIISMSIQRETGGNLGETLANLSKLLRDRRQMKLKIRAFSAEARAGAVIVGLLPFVVTGAILVVSPAYMMPLFTDPRGVVMLVIGGCMMAMGLFIMKRLATFEI